MVMDINLFTYIYSSIILVILFYHIVLIRRSSVINITNENYNEFIVTMRSILVEWVKEEHKLMKPIETYAGKEISLLYHLSNVNFKQIALDEEFQIYFDKLLVDTADVYTYSRLLDLYKYLYSQLPTRLLDAYADKYFQSFKLLDNTKYAHTKEQLKQLRKKYPYLWLLEDISIVNRTLSA